ncbi:hypothetical protein [Paracoccus sp. T5]|uniref:hypothetical protein n=1 Tax=Paracoccus sp. T5 TaxID=3402161 RepID=UPI003AE7D7A8
MTRFALTAVLASLAAVPASAGSMGMNERPEFVRPSMTAMTVDRRAGDIYDTRDLARRGLSANDIVQVTALPRGGMVDFSSRNGG